MCFFTVLRLHDQVTKACFMAIPRIIPLVPMDVRTCLLISDDPDDQVEFAEALHDIADDLVLITVIDTDRAVKLLASRKQVPDVILFDLSMDASDGEKIIQVLDGWEGLARVRLIVYGTFRDSARASHPRISAFLDQDMTFSRMRKVLSTLLSLEK